MPVTTYVNEDFWSRDQEDKRISEFLREAEAALGKRIAAEGRDTTVGTWPWFRRTWRVYQVLLDIGGGQAQVVNFAPRDDSDWSINTAVPATEVAAYLMGLATAKNRIETLERQVRVAAGLLSTKPGFDTWHPQSVLEYIANAAEEIGNGRTDQ